MVYKLCKVILILCTISPWLLSSTSAASIRGPRSTYLIPHGGFYVEDPITYRPHIPVADCSHKYHKFVTYPRRLVPVWPVEEHDNYPKYSKKRKDRPESPASLGKILHDDISDESWSSSEEEIPYHDFIFQRGRLRKIIEKKRHGDSSKKHHESSEKEVKVPHEADTKKDIVEIIEIPENHHESAEVHAKIPELSKEEEEVVEIIDALEKHPKITDIEVAQVKKPETDSVEIKASHEKHDRSSEIQITIPEVKKPEKDSVEIIDIPEEHHESSEIHIHIPDVKKSEKDSVEIIDIVQKPKESSEENDKIPEVEKAKIHVDEKDKNLISNIDFKHGELETEEKDIDDVLLNWDWDSTGKVIVRDDGEKPQAIHIKPTIGNRPHLPVVRPEDLSLENINDVHIKKEADDDHVRVETDGKNIVIHEKLAPRLEVEESSGVPTEEHNQVEGYLVHNRNSEVKPDTHEHPLGGINDDVHHWEEEETGLSHEEAEVKPTILVELSDEHKQEHEETVHENSETDHHEQSVNKDLEDTLETVKHPDEEPSVELPLHEDHNTQTFIIKKITKVVHDSHKSKETKDEEHPKPEVKIDVKKDEGKIKIKKQKIVEVNGEDEHNDKMTEHITLEVVKVPEHDKSDEELELNSSGRKFTIEGYDNPLEFLLNLFKSTAGQELVTGGNI